MSQEICIATFPWILKSQFGIVGSPKDRKLRCNVSWSLGTCGYHLHGNPDERRPEAPNGSLESGLDAKKFSHSHRQPTQSLNNSCAYLVKYTCQFGQLWPAPDSFQTCLIFFVSMRVWRLFIPA